MTRWLLNRRTGLQKNLPKLTSGVARIARTAIEVFGHFATWVNNAGVSVYGRFDQVDTEDMRRLFDTNFWGVVYGSLQAVAHFRERGAGALINLGSELSDTPIAMQGMYAASKHAVKGFTNCLRVELEMERLPVSVTLIKPAGIDTMFTAHAKNYMDQEPALPPPVYAPEVVADAILHCAEHAKRELFIGSAAKAAAARAYYTPRLLDRILRTVMVSAQKDPQPTAANRRDALYAYDPHTELRERSGKPVTVHETSSYTEASMRPSPLKKALIGGGLLLAVLSLARSTGVGNSAIGSDGASSI